MNRFILSCCLMMATLTNAKTINYELNIDTKLVDFSGEKVLAMAVNNSIPGPLLEFTEGDRAVISVKNLTNDVASIHWHGLLLPQEQDGVPYLTYFPIPPKGEFEYQFDLTHPGTYWYHSHTKIDEQKGQYGAIIVHPKKGYEIEVDHDVVVQLSDWTDEDPEQVLANLKKDGDWYRFKKDSVISVKGYLENSTLSAWLSNRWQRMEGMDISDVGYDAFLANGKTELNLLADAKAGDKVRIRLINSGASSYFDIQQRSGPFSIIAADGGDVVPVLVNELRIGMAETYDMVVTIPASGGYEFAANNIDGSGGVKIQIGSSDTISSPDPVRPDLFGKMSEDHNHAPDHSKTEKMNTQHAHHSMPEQSKSHHSMPHHLEQDKKIADKLDYTMLKTRTPISYEGEVQEFTLNLTGDMESYNWSFNNLPLSAADVIKIDRGKVVRFHFINKSMMHHPLHLHGHFFKVVSGNGEHDVLKHTVDVPPMAKVTIEFAANEYKDWFFHCHNLYHAKTGMARVVRYSDYFGNTAFVKAKMNSNEIMDSDWYKRGDVAAYSNFLEVKGRLSNSKHIVEFSAADYFSEHEFNLSYFNKQTKWLSYFVSFEQKAGHNEFKFGLEYMLPFNIESSIWLNQSGEIHAEAETVFQLTERYKLEFGASTETEWDISMEYRRSPNWAIALNANDTSGLGLGINVTF